MENLLLWSFAVHYLCVFAKVVNEMEKHLGFYHCIEHSHAEEDSHVLESLLCHLLTSKQTARCHCYIVWIKRFGNNTKFSFLIHHWAFLRKWAVLLLWETCQGDFHITSCFFQMFWGRVGKQVSKMLCSLCQGRTLFDVV